MVPFDMGLDILEYSVGILQIYQINEATFLLFFAVFRMNPNNISLNWFGYEW